MSAPAASYCVYAICADAGAVPIGSYDDAAQQRRAYLAAVRRWRDGGYAEEVTAIELESGEATDTQTVARANAIRNSQQEQS